MQSRPLIELGVDGVLALPNDEFYRLPEEAVATFHLELLRKRFEDLKPKIAALQKLSAIQGVDEIVEIDDVVRLLFQHTAYKSYPFSLLEKHKFQAMTRWLQSLTAHDLSHIDASGCDSIDSWFELLDRETPLSVLHSTGTSGKLSIIPRDKQEMERFVRAT
ncbi:MAG: hypothetical protein EOP21_10950, partial [Hyphomicrobiales bacterium]